MDILPFHFRTFQMCGMWYENSSFFLPKMIYRLAVLFVIMHFTLSQIVELATMKGSVDEFTEVMFLVLTFFVLCLKILNFLTRRDDMYHLLDEFRSPICQPKSAEEAVIIRDCRKTAARIYLSAMSLSQLTGLILLVLPIFSESYNQLPFKVYQFFNITNPVTFSITYTSQVLVAIYGVFLNVSMDTMTYGFIILATGQFKINCHRLENSTTSVRECIEHHVLIQDIVYHIQNFFIRVVVLLFFFSLITLCTSIFQISQKQVASFEFLSLTMYLACMLFQVFLYCWFGNELELKSKAVTDAVYLSEWADYTNEEKKNLWFVMLSSRRGSNISFHGQCGLTLQTFLWILKTSYASLNLLQQV